MWALCILGVRLLSCCKVRSMAWHITQQQRDGLVWEPPQPALRYMGQGEPTVKAPPPQTPPGAAVASVCLGVGAGVDCFCCPCCNVALRGGEYAHLPSAQTRRTHRRLQCALYALCALGVSAASDPPKCRLCGVVTLPKSAQKWDWALTGASCGGMRCPGQQLHSVASRFAHHSFARMLRAWASTASSMFFFVSLGGVLLAFVGTRLVLP